MIRDITGENLTTRLPRGNAIEMDGGIKSSVRSGNGEYSQVRPHVPTRKSDRTGIWTDRNIGEAVPTGSDVDASQTLAIAITSPTVCSRLLP